MLKTDKEIILNKFKYKIDTLLEQSKLLKNLEQVRLNKFI